MDRFDLLKRYGPDGYPLPQSAEQTGASQAMATPSPDYVRLLQMLQAAKKFQRPPEHGAIVRG